MPGQLSGQTAAHAYETHHLPSKVCNDGIKSTLQRRRERPEVVGEVALAHQRQRGETLSKGDVVPAGWGWVGAGQLTSATANVRMWMGVRQYLSRLYW